MDEHTHNSDPGQWSVCCTAGSAVAPAGPGGDDEHRHPPRIHFSLHLSPSSEVRMHAPVQNTFQFPLNIKLY